MPKRKKAKDSQARAIEIKWSCEKNSEAEARFWKLWLQLALEQVMKSESERRGQP